MRRDLAKYEEMTTLHLGSKTWIILNSHRVMTELIAKRVSQINASSPMLLPGSLVIPDTRSLIIYPRAMDGAAPSHARAPKWLSAREIRHTEEEESTLMMADYAMNPTKWYRHHCRYGI